MEAEDDGAAAEEEGELPEGWTRMETEDGTPYVLRCFAIALQST